MSYFKNILLLTSIILFTSCEKEIKYAVNGSALGTSYNINYYATQKQNLKPKLDSIFEAINNSISTYVSDSDISKFNRGQEVVVDEHFKTVFKSSKYIYSGTAGYFDPSIGILVNAYGFGPEKFEQNMSQSTIDSLMSYVGFDHFELNDAKISTDLENFYLDFNANGKGYAVDVVANYLKDKGITNFFVEIGGEIVASGYNLSNNQSWTFGIERPVEDNNQRDLSYAIVLNEKALATSGNYRKFRTDGATGLKYVHTINPKTGMAQKSNVLSASVVAENCMTADGFATAFMAMGFEMAKDVIEKEKISAIIIYADEGNNIKSYVTKDIEDSITEY